jgi:glucokinase
MRGVWAGVDVGGTRIKIGLADNRGRLLSSETIETRDCRDAEGFLENVCDKILTLAGSASVSVRGVGIGCPGRIDYAAGRVVWLKTKLEFLEGIPLTQRLTERLRCPVVCDNDANTILAGEMRFGSGQGYRNVVAIAVGTGIGGALVLNGHMVRGSHWAAGHFGYMSLDPRGTQHVCGNTGVVEENASQSGVLKQLHCALEAGEVSPLTASLAREDEPGLRELFQCAERGDPLGQRLKQQLILSLGTLIANLIFALDPDAVLVGGGGVNHQPELFDAIQREAAGRVGFLSPSATKILPMALGDASGILGGVALAMDAGA